MQHTDNISIGGTDSRTESNPLLDKERPTSPLCELPLALGYTPQDPVREHLAVTKEAIKSHG